MNIHYIHFYVEDAKASHDWFVKYMGFHSFACGSNPDTLTTVVKSGEVYFVLSSPLTPESPVAQYLHLHPPGVADIAFVVSDVEDVIAKAIENGAKVLQPIQEQQFPQGHCKWGTITAWGSLKHTIVERTGITPQLSILSVSPVLIDCCYPAQQQGTISNSVFDSGFFTGIDHVVLNVAEGDLEKAVCWYEDVLGFQRQKTFTIQTHYSGLHSRVMVHPTSGVQFPINEPASANSQIQEFLEVNRGPGIQHIALQTPQIVKAIAHLRQLGLSFLPIPSSYYTQLQNRPHRCHLSTTQLQEIAAQQILIDWQDNSPHALLLQTFTQPIFQEPTFFFELIERRQDAQGFGEGNFRALFEAIEREQIKRGSLPVAEVNIN
ncbi:MAG TPA: 4-hydroxyphenylpyruvate dioxygenase [Coleofasciculaceae cyanobacterium]